MIDVDMPTICRRRHRRVAADHRTGPGHRGSRRYPTHGGDLETTVCLDCLDTTVHRLTSDDLARGADAFDPVDERRRLGHRAVDALTDSTFTLDPTGQELRGELARWYTDDHVAS